MYIYTSDTHRYFTKTFLVGREVGTLIALPLSWYKDSSVCIQSESAGEVTWPRPALQSIFMDTESKGTKWKA
jgi:hypothetical protein